MAGSSKFSEDYFLASDFDIILDILVEEEETWFDDVLCGVVENVSTVV